MKTKHVAPIYIFLGEDTKRAREGLTRALEEEKAVNPHCTVNWFDDISFDPALTGEAIGNVSLFGGRNIIVIEGILDHERGEEFYETLPRLKETANLILIREAAPKKELRALFGKIGEVKEFLLKKLPEKKNNFLIADAVAMKDKRLAWVEFTKLERAGAATEEVHGMIFWAMKMLFLCKTETKEGALRAGVKEFTYRNYEPRAKRFLLSELESKLAELKEMYHVAHEGGGDLGLSLEQFLLKL